MDKSNKTLMSNNEAKKIKGEGPYGVLIGASLGLLIAGNDKHSNAPGLLTVLGTLTPS